MGLAVSNGVTGSLLGNAIEVAGCNVIVDEHLAFVLEDTADAKHALSTSSQLFQGDRQTFGSRSDGIKALGQ